MILTLKYDENEDLKDYLPPKKEQYDCSKRLWQYHQF